MTFTRKIPLALAASTALVAIGAPALSQTTQPAATTAATPAQTATPAAAAAPAPAATPTMTIAQALSQSSDHLTLNRLINAANLQATLSGPGPITIFAPNDAAFSRLAPGTVDTLLKPENAKSLRDILTYHAVRGSIGVLQLKKQIEAAGGSMTLTTLQGQTITANEEPSGALSLTDANGNKSYINKASAAESNGVIEYVNGVLTPKLGADGNAEAGAAGSDTGASSGSDQTAPSGSTDDTSGTTPAGTAQPSGG